MNDMLPITENHLSRFESWDQANEAKKKAAWKALDKIKVRISLELWLETLGFHTARAYRYGMLRLSELTLIDLESSLQSFSQINHNAVIDQIKLVDSWAESTRQARAACYISFTGFLSRRTNGIVIKGLPLREGNAKTFFKVRHKVKTPAMTQKQWTSFFQELTTINSRDALIGKLMLQGGKRISEALSVRIEDINWQNREITYTQAKTKGTERNIIITYPEYIIQDLSRYMAGRETGLAFITRNKNKIHPGQIERNFAKAGQRAIIPFKVTPHVMRASLVTFLKMNGFNDTDIMEVTGHHSAEMIASYNKLEAGDNLTKRVNLV